MSFNKKFNDMKNSVLLSVAILTLSAFNLLAQDIMRSEVPPAILNNFEQEFASARDVEWEKEGALYKVDFEHKRRIDMEVWYSGDGNVVRQEEEWRKSNLPEMVIQVIKSEYPDHKIEDVKKITENGQVQFKLDLDARQQPDLNIWVGEDGRILRSERD